MAALPHRHCAFCGAAYADISRYPRTCPNPTCGMSIWANPVPVVVLLLPVRRGDATGLLAVRRGIDPGRGRLALGGGFCEAHETWQEGGARELREEIAVRVDPAAIEPFWFASSQPVPNRVLLFGVAPPVDTSTLPPFAPNDETLERGALFGPQGLDELLAFGLHAEAARRWFAREGITGPHGYAPL